MSIQQVPVSERFRSNPQRDNLKDPEREKGEIELAVLDLVNAIDQHDKLLGLLPGRLNPVLSPDTPTSPGGAAPPPVGGKSGLGDTLFTQSQRIRDLSGRLSAIVDRICL